MRKIVFKSIAHIVIKDPHLMDEEKKQFNKEFYSLLSYIVSLYDSFSLVITKNANNQKNQNPIEIYYLFPDDKFDYNIQNLRYYKIEDHGFNKEYQLYFDNITSTNRNISINKKLNLFLVGNIPYLVNNAPILSKILNNWGDKWVFKIPMTKRITIIEDDYKWKNTLHFIRDHNGGLSISVQKYHPNDFTVKYATQCLSLFLNMYTNKIYEAEIMDYIHSLQTLISNENIFKVNIQAFGDIPEGIKYSFLKDFSIESFEIENNTKNIISKYKEQELNQYIQDIINIWTIDELFHLIQPPVSFKDALPGVDHFVPKPYIFPQIRINQDENVICFGTLENGIPICQNINTITQHIFVTGTTGGGKTNTIMYLLNQYNNFGLNFLIIDPVKIEYESFMNKLNLNDHIINFRDKFLTFNPFIPAANINLYAHSSILAKIFSVIFPTTPLAHDYILAMIKSTYLSCLENHFKRKISTKDLWKFFGRDFKEKKIQPPDLKEFISIGQKWLEKLYKEDKTSEAIQHFSRRWELLSKSIIANLLSQKDVSFFDLDLLNENWLIELYNIIDYNEKNILISLLMSLIYEQRISDGISDFPLHVTVIEEAHRIIPSEHESKQKDLLTTSGQEVSTLISNMLSEIRAFGEGIIIAEQSPSKIIPDAIINTSTKIIHKTVFGLDQKVLGESIGLSQREKEFLTYLKIDKTRSISEAIAIFPGIYQPIYINIPKFNF